jgi:glycosyltransferase involved in cell wall biosynthesis
MPHLATAIQSILNQKIVDFEIIISDDSSIDGTTKFLKELGLKEMKLLHPPRRLSAGENWTFVTEAASGKYVKLICADDYLLDESTKFEIQKLEEFPNAVATFGSRIVVSENGRTLLKIRNKKISHGLVEGNEVLRRSFLAGRNLLGEPANLMFRREYMQKALPWSSDIPYLLDMSLYVKVFQNQQLVSLENFISAFRIRTKSISHTSSGTQSAQFQNFFKNSFIAEDLKASRKSALLSSTNSQLNQNLRAILYKYSKVIDAISKVHEKLK